MTLKVVRGSSIINIDIYRNQWLYLIKDLLFIRYMTKMKAISKIEADVEFIINHGVAFRGGDDMSNSRDKTAILEGMTQGSGITKDTKEAAKKGSNVLSEMIDKVNARNELLLKAAKEIAKDAEILNGLNLKGSDVTTMNLDSKAKEFFEKNLTQIYKVAQTLKESAKELKQLTTEQEAELKEIKNQSYRPR